MHLLIHMYNFFRYNIYNTHKHNIYNSNIYKSNIYKYNFSSLELMGFLFGILHVYDNDYIWQQNNMKMCKAKGRL